MSVANSSGHTLQKDKYSCKYCSHDFKHRSPYLKHQLKGCKDKTVAKKNRKEADKIMKEIDAHHSSSRRLSPWNASMLPLANTSDTGLPGPPPGPAGPSSYPNIIPIAHPTGGSSSDSGLSGGKKNKGKK